MRVLPFLKMLSSEQTCVQMLQKVRWSQGIR
jgi:hypothetical protein